MPAAPAKHHTHGVVGALNREWQMLRHHPDGTAALRQWAAAEPALAAFADLAAIEAEIRRRAGRDCDAILIALLRRARSDSSSCARRHESARHAGALAGALADELAARTIMQLMLPKAIRIARSQMHHLPGREECYATAVGCLTEVVRTYPVDRRPRRVAANIGLDTLNLMRRITVSPLETVAPLFSLEEQWCDETAHSRADRTPTMVLGKALELKVIGPNDDLVAETLLAPDRPAGPRERLVQLLTWAVERHVLSASDAALLADTYRADAPGDAVLATAQGCKPNTLRQRRRRAITRLERAAARFLEEAA